MSDSGLRDSSCVRARRGVTTMVFAALVALPALAQQSAQPKAVSPSAAWSAPRTVDGHPDLQGVWTNVSLTTLERPAQFKSLVLPREEAAKIEARAQQRKAAGDLPTDPKTGAPPKGKDVGGYNSVYIDAGSTFGVVNGEARTSWVVDPPDGKLPYSAAGLKIYRDTLMEKRNTFDGPEIRPLGERCVVGYGSTAGPPMINVLYNNNYQIVQAKDRVVILVEMNHDARVIRMNDKHRPSNLRPWMGDSIGWWDGDTLVVETVNFHPQESLRTNTNVTFYISKDAKVTERFTRVGPDDILYEFAVDDPATFSQVWRAQMPMKRTAGPINEYACHEGNHSLPGILAGARADERRGRKTNVNADGE